LLRVVHDHDDAEALRLLRAVRRCLPDDGMVLLAEPMSDAPGAERVGAAYFGFYLLAMRSGRARAPERLCALLCEAGFERPQVIYPRLPLQAVMVTAHASK
jgi:demethylspheroidene O-methyltransferase